ncbi:MAG TPA: hypothetical protein VKB79_08065 [Bryobacteraceae bacterium]|nr:hypothetical protein [Bryobacteraceae bacterium]
MKTIANRIFQCAAGAMLLGASAFGQNVMTANIPFAFHANGTTMPAGSYRIGTSNDHGGTAVIQLRDADANKSALAVGAPLNFKDVPDQAPHLVFHCKDSGGCDLRQVCMPYATYSYPSKAKDRADDRVASIPLTNNKAD